MKKSGHTGDVPRPGDKIHIPLKTDEALRLALRVKPTKDMPRPGAQPTDRPKRHWIKKGKAACGAAVAESANHSEVTCRSCLALMAREDLIKGAESSS